MEMWHSCSNRLAQGLAFNNKIDHQIWYLGWVFELNFGPNGHEFEQSNLQKFNKYQIFPRQQNCTS